MTNTHVRAHSRGHSYKDAAGKRDEFKLPVYGHEHVHHFTSPLHHKFVHTNGKTYQFYPGQYGQNQADAIKAHAQFKRVYPEHKHALFHHKNHHYVIYQTN
jgi:hypothetical protein